MHAVNGNGVAIPALGFGTWELRGSTAQRLVEAALALGYRHIDTAQMYGNEAEVGAALKASGLRREDYFLTTKIWPDHFGRGERSGRRPSGSGSGHRAGPPAAALAQPVHPARGDDPGPEPRGGAGAPGISESATSPWR